MQDALYAGLDHINSSPVTKMSAGKQNWTKYRIAIVGTLYSYSGHGCGLCKFVNKIRNIYYNKYKIT